MVDIAKRHQDALCRIRKNVEEAYEYFKPNFQRWHEFQKFVFVTSLSDDDIAILKTLQKPQIEFNILNAFVSRLRGEFSKQEPSIQVSAAYDSDADPRLINTVEGHFRHMECEARENGTSYRIYTDQLAGGFSWYKVWTEYAHEKSMQQVIKFGRVFDPTLCFCDPLAQETHKGDARYWGELFPKSKEEFEEEYPDIDISSMKYSRNIGGFNWAYRNEKRQILLICDYYEKKKKKVKIVELPNGKTLTMDEYNQGLEEWEKAGRVEQPPVIVKSRITNIDVICRYRFIQDQVIEYIETEFKKPNYIFVDGDSVYIRNSVNGAVQQQTKPYVYHAKGLQRLKNLAGQTIANNIENQVQHKFKVAKESIPPEYADAYENVQLANTLIYNAFKDDDPNVPLPAPMEIAVVPSPPENLGIFASTDQTVQTILGSYDASLGINNNQLSGVAIVEGATQSNAAAMPYIVNNMLALNQVAQVVLDIIPKYIITPTSLPIVDQEGKKSFVHVNKPGGVDLRYSDNSLNIKVEAGLNFSIQKSRALQQIIGLMQASPLFSQFMNQKGLAILLDNLEIRGVDQLKVLADVFMKEMKQQQAMAMKNQQQAAQNNPLMMRAQNERMKIAQSAQSSQIDAQIKTAEIAVSQQEADNERLRLLAEIDESKRDQLVQLDKHQTEKTRAAVDFAIKSADMAHRHNVDKHRLIHEKVELHDKLSKNSKNKEDESQNVLSDEY